jgi:hypothetical protein
MLYIAVVITAVVPIYCCGITAVVALTASSHLACLELYNPPEYIWQYVFPAVRNLPHLTSFTVAPDPTEIEDMSDFVLPHLWDGSDFVRLVTCCPNLHSIGGIWVEHGMDVFVLHKLTGLTNLSISYDTAELESIDESVEYLAGLRSLRSLRLTILEDDTILEDEDHTGLPSATFLPLTSLNSLTRLEYCCFPDTLIASPECEEFTLLSSVSATKCDAPSQFHPAT